VVDGTGLEIVRQGVRIVCFQSFREQETTAKQA